VILARDPLELIRPEKVQQDMTHLRDLQGRRIREIAKAPRLVKQVSPPVLRQLPPPSGEIEQIPNLNVAIDAVPNPRLHEALLHRGADLVPMRGLLRLQRSRSRLQALDLLVRAHLLPDDEEVDRKEFTRKPPHIV
jgi:hypothetical protein